VDSLQRIFGHLGGSKTLPDTATKTHSLQRLILEITLVLLLAAATRIIHSSQWPVWTDEGWTIWAVQSHDFNTVVNTLANDRHPPAYFLALSAWSSLTGDSRLALRYLSMMIGLLTVAAVYRTGRDWFGHRAGLYAALLMAVLSMPVYYSQEIRHYGLLALATTLMSLCFLRYLRRPTLTRLIPYVLAVVLMLYTQWLGLAVLALQIGFGLVIWRGSLRQKGYLLAAWAVAFVFYLPWLPISIVQVGANFGGGGFNNSIGHTAYVLGDFIRLLDKLLDGQFVLLGGACLLALLSLRRREHLYIVLGGLGLYALFFLISQKMDILTPRTVLYVVPMLAVLAGYGLQQIQAPRLRWVLVSLLVVAVLVRGTIVQGRIDADHIAQEVASHVDSSDLVVLQMDWDNYTMMYELKQAGVKATVFAPHMAHAINTVNQPITDMLQRTDIRPMLKDYRRILVLRWIEPEYVIPLLKDPQYGYHQAMAFEIPVGKQLRAFLGDQGIQTVLFERFDAATIKGQFGDLFALHEANFTGTAQPGETIFTDLWWSASAPPKLDYSVGVYLMDANQQIVAQSDAAPGDLPTSQWVINDLHFDRHGLVLPPNLAAGTYQVAVSMYWFGDQKPLPVAGKPLLVVGHIQIGAP